MLRPHQLSPSGDPNQPTSTAVIGASLRHLAAAIRPIPSPRRSSKSGQPTAVCPDLPFLAPAVSPVCPDLSGFTHPSQPCPRLGGFPFRPVPSHPTVVY